MSDYRITEGIAYLDFELSRLERKLFRKFEDILLEKGFQYLSVPSSLMWSTLEAQGIQGKEHYDRIFVYSDMQAGHGGLYGHDPSQYRNYIWGSRRYIDVAALVAKYRAEVNPNVFVYMVQVAGYQDTLVPEYYDRTYILGGWSDSILKFAANMEASYK